MKLSTTLILTGIGLPITAAILFPVFAQAKACSKCVSPLSDAKNIGLGLLQYAAECDERFPHRDLWMDEIAPYVKSEPLFHAREAPKGAYGYAFNGALDLAKAPEDAACVPMVYDSVNPIRNASDLVTSLPNPGRHKGRNVMAYADGHAKLLGVGAKP